MATDQDFVDYVCEQISGVGPVTYKKMFGEYALYANEKVFAFACDNQLFIKPTNAGREFIGKPVEAPPYPGAKMYFMVNEKLDDADWLSQLIKISYAELPAPKAKKTAADKTKKTTRK